MPLDEFELDDSLDFFAAVVERLLLNCRPQSELRGCDSILLQDVKLVQLLQVLLLGSKLVSQFLNSDELLLDGAVLMLCQLFLVSIHLLL